MVDGSFAYGVVHRIFGVRGPYIKILVSPIVAGKLKKVRIVSNKFLDLLFDLCSDRAVFLVVNSLFTLILVEES